MPTTTEELREVLRAFKEQDANGNGDPNDEIPLSGSPENLHLGYLAGYLDVYKRQTLRWKHAGLFT